MSAERFTLDTNILIYAVDAREGRKRELAARIIEAASKQAVAGKQSLRAVLENDPRVTALLDAKKLADLFEPMAYQGVSQALIDRLLASLEC